MDRLVGLKLRKRFCTGTKSLQVCVLSFGTAAEWLYGSHKTPSRLEGLERGVKLVPVLFVHRQASLDCGLMLAAGFELGYMQVCFHNAFMMCTPNQCHVVEPHTFRVQSTLYSGAHNFISACLEGGDSTARGKAKPAEGPQVGKGDGVAC
ncbi:hypothetical protein ABBQ38_013002 [Trebouxia sp. C0009 RCD-2024]